MLEALVPSLGRNSNAADESVVEVLIPSLIKNDPKARLFPDLIPDAILI